MADGTIKIAIEVDGKQINVTTDSLKKLELAGRQSGDGLKETEKGAKGAGNESNKAMGNIKKFATSLGLVAIGATAFNVLKKSIDSAITRFDTLNKFPKVLQALGVSAEDSEKSMSKLSDGIDGLPTKLDEIASTAQRMYTSFGDMDKATDSAIALNNTLLGSGASADQAKRGTEQYLKALQTGKMEMDTWNSLSETMDVGLVKIAESFGFAGKSAKDDLYKALKDGSITMDDFNDKMIELGTGTGIMAQLAKENSLGLATSMQNLGTAVSRNVANMITKFDNLTKEVTGKTIAENIDSLKGVVDSAFKVMGSAIDGVTPLIKGFFNVVSASMPIIKAITPALIGMATAYAMHEVIGKTVTALKASQKITTLVTTAKKLYTLAIMQSTTGLITNTAIEKAHSIAIASKNTLLKVCALAYGVMTGAISASTAVQTIATTATYALGTAINFLTGPIGWVTLGVGALAGATVAIIKWFKRTSEEAERLNEETEALGESTQSLKDSINNSSDAYKENQKEIESSSKVNEEYARKIEELAEKENKSATEKEMLKSYIDELNSSVEGLNLTYDAEADALNMSSEQMQARIDLMKEQETAQEAQERLTEILTEQQEVEAQLAETNKLREEWNQKLEDGTVKSGEHKDAIAELDEQEKTLNETTAQLAEQQKLTEEQMTASMNAITEATQNGVALQTIAFDDLSESQQKTVESLKSKWEEYKESATDMFDTLSDEVTLTADEMATNLEENQRIISEWADNIAVLADRGVDQGLLDTLREAGPESAGHVNALVNASDDELERLSDVFSEGGQVATDALSKSLGIEETTIMQSVGHLITDTEDSLRKQVENADFPGIGEDLTGGMAEGVEKGTKEVAGATEQMAIHATDSAKDALGVRSPSRVFKEIGKNTTEGMKLGISNGTSKVSGASRRLALNIVKPFNKTPSQFRTIGINATTGLTAGLNAGRGRVMATARSIANQVASTMKSALKIHSPSRLMRDDIGFNIPAGIAVGIKDNAKSVFREINDLTSGIMKVGTPELALKTSNMAVASATNQSVSNALIRPQSTIQSNRNAGFSAPDINMSAVLMLGSESFPVLVRKITKEQEWQKK